MGIGSGYYSYHLINKKIKERNRNKYRSIYGLSLRMSNGDDPIYTTTDKDLIFRVRNAVTESINNTGGRTSVNFDNVNIEITDSEKVEIGNIVNR